MRKISTLMLLVSTLCGTINAEDQDPINFIELHSIPEYDISTLPRECYPLDLNQRFYNTPIGPFVFASWKRGESNPNPITNLKVKVCDNESSCQPDGDWKRINVNINENDPPGGVTKHVYLFVIREKNEKPIYDIRFTISTENDPDPLDDYEFCLGDNNKPINLNPDRFPRIYLQFTKEEPE